MKSIIHCLAVAAISIFFTLNSGCNRVEPAAELVVSPAGPSSRLPYLATGSDGTVFLSWVESIDSVMVALHYARLLDDGWSDADTIARGSDWFVNWADFPSLTAGNGTPLAAHWLHKTPGNTYSYDVKISTAADSSWNPAITPHDDGTATEHGFVSLIPWNGAPESVLAVWLDGRRTAGRADDEYGDLSKAMTLRSAVIDRDGTVSSKAQIDETVCDCCQTSLAKTESGAIAAYRDRTEDEIRDIYVSRYADGDWSTPIRVHEDNWKIGGCPVNGPVVVSSGDRVLVAWFTGANDTYRVKAALSTDGGRSFREPVIIDEGETIGRVDAVFTGPDAAVVSWMEKTGEEAALRVRKINLPANTAGGPLTITPMDPDRSSGFPQMARYGNLLVFAWTETGDPSRVRVATYPAERLPE